jgi:hypothetical protein
MALKGTLKKKKSGIKLQGSLGPFIGEFPLIASCLFLIRYNARKARGLRFLWP